MIEQKIERIIKELEGIENIDNEAYVGFFYENDDYAYISANKQGVIKLTFELLKKIKDFDYHFSKEGHFSVIPLKPSKWVDNNSHIFFDYIIPKKEVREVLLKEKLKNSDSFKKTIKEKFSNLLFFIILFFFILSLIVGSFNIIKFIINLF